MPAIGPTHEPLAGRLVAAALLHGAFDLVSPRSPALDRRPDPGAPGGAPG